MDANLEMSTEHFKLSGYSKHPINKNQGIGVTPSYSLDYLPMARKGRIYLPS